MSADPNALDGATHLPEEGTAVTDPGEFAARWNQWNDQRRRIVLDAMNHVRDDAERCFIENHRGELDHRRAQVDAVTRLHRHPDGDDPASTYCAHDDNPWPCPTLRALGVTS